LRLGHTLGLDFNGNPDIEDNIGRRRLCRGERMNVASKVHPGAVLALEAEHNRQGA
jgi:hypothetical protein